MKKVLITGGPVHAYLDAVKVITNRFKGGLMCELAEALARLDCHVTYLCAPTVGAQRPQISENLTLETHTGFEDYRKKVLALAPDMDGVILGAAVANLIPANPWKGKFPSHNYKPGDIVPIDFMVAPRIIDEVKRAAPKTQLFGYKLLSDVSHKELIRAAYGIVLEAGATAVIANDAQNLLQKFAVTKERGIHQMSQFNLAPWIFDMLTDEYYATAFQPDVYIPKSGLDKLQSYIRLYHDKFVSVESGLIFGTVAVRHKSGFVTTGRGKRELDSFAYVTRVDHDAKTVHVASDLKASLNAPLLARLFENPRVDTVLHYHAQEPNLPTYPYAPPGTVRDTDRRNHTSFNIADHGCMRLFDSEGHEL